MAPIEAFAVVSIAEFRVHYVKQGIASSEALQVFHQQYAVTNPVAAITGNVWRDNHIVQLPKRVIGWQRLRFGDVQRSACNLPTFQRSNQVSGNDASASPDIYEMRTLFGCSEKRRIKQSGRFGCQR